MQPEPEWETFTLCEMLENLAHRLEALGLTVNASIVRIAIKRLKEESEDEMR